MSEMYVIVDTSGKDEDGTVPVMGGGDFIHAIGSVKEVKEALDYYVECGHSPTTTHIYKLVRVEELGVDCSGGEWKLIGQRLFLYGPTGKLIARQDLRNEVNPGDTLEVDWKLVIE